MWDETKFEREGGMRGEPVEELILIQVHPMDPAKTTKLGAMLPEDAQENFKAFLVFTKNLNIFTWSHEDMLGIAHTW